MRHVVAGMVVAVLSASVGTVAQEQTADCQFKLRQVKDAAKPIGPEEVVSRARILPQPDSPIVITKADFSGSQLNVVPGSFQWRPAVTLELLNVSDQPVSDVRTWVMLRSHDLSGVGDGGRWQPTLAPGARAQVVVRGGKGKGGFQGDVFVDVLIEAVTFEGCVYRPSQAIRTGVAASRWP
jgi:hypothetical protein